MKPKICFFALSSYSVLSNRNLGFIGGAELQQVLIGRELAKKGYNVSFLVFDHGQRVHEEIGGIKIYKTVQKGLALSPKTIFISTIKILSILKQVNSDIYIQECAGRGYDTGFISLFCFLSKKKFLFLVSSDADVDGTLRKRKGYLANIFYKVGLKRADCIITQSEYQQSLLRKNYDKDSIIIKNPYPIEKVEIKKSIPPVVLWVGTIKPLWKQPELFLKLATEIPDIEFQMVGGASWDKKFYNKIKEKAERIPNLEFFGFVPYPDVNKYFNNASILVNTSSIEGFSNTFLQAWSVYTPVISLNANPDGIISKFKLGCHSKTFEQMVKDVKILLRDNNLREEMGVNGRRYVEKEHDIKVVINGFEKIFSKVCRENTK